MDAPGDTPHDPAAVPAGAWTDPAVVAATCGWIGRIPFAPGTWGAAAGIPLALALGAGAAWLAPRLLPGVAAGATIIEAALAGIVCLAGVPLCGAAARRLGGADPGPIVYDELASMPLVLLAVPAAARTPPLVLLAFVLLRVFDIAKPFPCRRLERLPGGLGIMADDWGAAVLAAGCLALARWRGWA